LRYFRLLILSSLLFILMGLISVPLSLAGSGTINDNGVNVRSGPGTDYSILNTLTKGTAITIVETKGDWQQIQYGNLKGWVLSRFISAGSTTGSPSSYRLRVTGDLVNLRSGPDTGYNKVGQAHKGDILTVVDTEGNWYHVKTAGGLDAYILAEYVEKDGAASPDAPIARSNNSSAAVSYVKVVDGPANVRSAPNSSSTKVTMLNQNTIYPVLGREGDWYKIRLSDGRTGYIASWLVQATSNTAGSQSATEAASPKSVAEDKPITVILDGKTLSFAVAPLVDNGTTLVPLRAIFEAMGATVAWDGNTRTVKAIRGETTVVLTVGSTNPTIDGEVHKISTPARIIKNNTLVPMRFVAEAFGAEVDWNQGTRTVTITSSPDSEEGLGKGQESDIEVNNNKIGEDVIRLSRSKDESGIKICMKSGAELKGEIDTDDDQVTYEFPDRHIEGLFFFEEALGQGTVKVRGSSEDDKALIVIEFPDKTVYRTSSEDGGKTEVLTIVNAIQSVEQRKFGGTGDRLVITTATPVKYTHHQEDDSIIINLKNIELGSAHDEYEYDDSLIKLVQVKKNGEAEGGVTVTINTSGLGKYTTGFTNNGTVLNIMMVGKNSLKARNNNLVVLDPGHGGKDPGARGTKLNEKDVNLAIALKVGELLKQKGIQVEYTRSTDVFVDLEPRAKIANDLNPGVFVSIHSNASPDTTVQGTETYYYAPMEVPELFMMQDERKALGAKVHQVLVNRIGRPSRGVKTANFSVLRNTDMPSILIETAFISNPEEEQMLMSDAFRNGAAQGIADGIAAYLGK